MLILTQPEVTTFWVGMSGYKDHDVSKLPEPGNDLGGLVRPIQLVFVLAKVDQQVNDA